MIRRFNCDDPETMRLLAVAARTHGNGSVGAIPRKTAYGDSLGLLPFGEAFPDLVVEPNDYKEVIRHCHDEQIFPLYHQRASWAPSGKRWNQNGLNYCWSWGGTAALMDIRAREEKPAVELAPVSMGYLVNWRNAGNYLESMIDGLKKTGVCSAEFVPDPFSMNPRKFKAGWDEDRLNYRLGEVWDCDPRRMLQHSLSVLRTGTPLYIAYNWWGHALEVVAIRWDESQRDNVVWVIRNSHNEDDVIELTGANGVPDEAYGFRASLTDV